MVTSEFSCRAPPKKVFTQSLVSCHIETSSHKIQPFLNGAPLPCNDGAKCLGYVWDSTLLSKPMIEHIVLKARKAYGSIGVYQGPLSCLSLIETCDVLISCMGEYYIPLLDKVSYLQGLSCWKLSDANEETAER